MSDLDSTRRHRPRRGRPERLAVLGLLIAGLLALSAGCAGDPAPAARDATLADELAGAPAWVRVGCRALAGSGERVVCGVGVVGATRTPARARRTAISRARTEIARTLETRLQAMLKDRQASGGADGGAEETDQAIVDVSRQITRLCLAGTAPRETWTSARGSVYALVVLDLDAFEASLAGMSAVPADVRAAVTRDAESLFEPGEQGAGTP